MDLYASLADDLAELARRNVREFSEDPSLHAHYLSALGSRRMRYATDPETCGKPDCWSTWSEKVEEQCNGIGDEDTTILLDCEDDAAAIAGSLKVRGVESYIGVVPGLKISHAIAGYLAPGSDAITILDPAVWHGMRGEIHYSRPIEWRKV